jgi:hypothetical protein
MKTKLVTIWLLIVTTTILIGWDIYVALTPQRGDTISEILLHTAQYASLLPAALGFLMGHLFWPRERGGFSLPGTIGSVSFFAGRDVLAFFWPVIAVPWWPIVALLIGIILGHFFWAQRPPTFSELLDQFRKEKQPRKP